MLKTDDFEQAGIVEHGHFVFASGQHSTVKVEMDNLWTVPQLLDQVLNELAETIDQWPADAITGVPSGGMRLAAELVSRRLVSRPLITIGKQDGQFFLVDQKAAKYSHVVIVEDVVTTLGSAAKTAACLPPGTDCSVIAIWRRGQTLPDLIKKFSRVQYLLEQDLPTWTASDCPVCIGEGNAADRRI